MSTTVCFNDRVLSEIECLQYFIFSCLADARISLPDELLTVQPSEPTDSLALVLPVPDESNNQINLPNSNDNPKKITSSSGGKSGSSLLINNCKSEEPRKSLLLVQTSDPPRGTSLLR